MANHNISIIIESLILYYAHIWLYAFVQTCAFVYA